MDTPSTDPERRALTDPAVTAARRLLVALLLLMVAVPAASWTTAVAGRTDTRSSTYTASDTVPARMGNLRLDPSRDRETPARHDAHAGPRADPAVPSHLLGGTTIDPATGGTAGAPYAGLAPRTFAHHGPGSGGTGDGWSARGPPVAAI